MPQLRRDPVIGRWVIISTERAKRPDGFAAENIRFGDTPNNSKCHFCEGNESQTPPEIYAVRNPGSRPNGPGWKTRVIPSIAPLLRIEADIDRRGHGMYDLMNARGAHEIIIDTPRHVTESGLSELEITASLNTALDRITDLERDPRIKYVLVFKNYGDAAGAGRARHSITQLIGTPVNLKRVKEELEGAKTYYGYRDRCIYCDIIKQERDMGNRIMEESRNFIAVAPFASRFPFETWVMPKRHSCDFYKTDRGEVGDLARLMWSIFSRMSKVIGDFPYNIVLHTAPFRRNAGKKGYWDTIEYDYHWHLEILPILTRVAGFEWGSGFYINPLPPEDACKSIQEAR